MKRKYLPLIVAALIGCTTAIAAPMGSGFTYQGQLQFGGSPANGTYDFQFSLWDALSDGTQIGTMQTISNVTVSDGVFTATPDFGGEVFDGEALWLQVGVRTGTNAFVVLTPNQPVTATPYAWYATIAATANLATTAISAATAGSAAMAETANSFSGFLAGDVTGTQGVTIVGFVGGQSAANVASGANAANGATSANTPNALVARDASGNFSAGVITATSFVGSGAALTDFTATNLTGTLSDSQLSTNVALLDGTNAFTGTNSFAGVALLTNVNNVIDGLFVGNLTGDVTGNAGSANVANFASSAEFADEANFADFAENFSGPLVGDVSGSQYGTVVNMVGGVTAANVASAANAANGATSANTPNALVARDASGNFSAGVISATSFVGSGAALTDFAATNLTGTLSDSQLSTNVALLDGTNAFTGTNSFAGVALLTNVNNVINGAFTGDLNGNATTATTANSANSAISAATAGSATTAGTANNFSGALAGDVTGTQGATVVGFVGGQTAANVASGSSAANAATGADIAGTIVARDASGNFSAGTITAISFDGSGAGLINVDAATVGGLAAGNFWQTGGNAGTTPGPNYVGTSDNQPLVLSVNGAQALELLPGANGQPNIVGGAGNSIDPSDYSTTIAGGTQNSIETNAYLSFIGGGNGNVIENDSSYSTIGGGLENSIQSTALYSAIAGGAVNTIQSNSYLSFIGGGEENVIQAYSEGSFIGSGLENLIQTNSAYSTIGGGVANSIQAYANVSFIGGGQGNSIQYGADQSAIAGGIVNHIQSNAFQSFIGGGNGNTIQVGATYGMIPGGRDNTIGTDATSSLAAGQNANAVDANSFVWGDGSAATTSAAAGSVTFRASGGYALYSDSGATGASLAAGSGSWTSMSDRNMKTNFAPVNMQGVLDKVAALPVTTWNYKSQAAEIHHMGPTAQDFKAAFTIGETDTGISTVDEAGVALAAIKGLNERLEVKLKTQDAVIQSLEQRLEQLEKAGSTQP